MSIATRFTTGAFVAALFSVAVGAVSAQAVAPKVGTDGAGLEFEYGIARYFGARLEINGGTLSHHVNRTNIDYEGHLHFSNVQALGDWHPFAGAWRVSTGLVYNDNKIDLNAAPSTGTLTINGNSYPAGQVGSLQGTLSFPKISPYLGIGWGISPRGKGLFGSIDLGVQYQANHVSLTGTCGPAIQGTATCTQLQSDVAAEQLRLQDETRAFRFWPVTQIGIGWRFF
jgi:hypothetical protein